MWRCIISVLFLSISLLAQADEQTARAALNRGVAAFKNARYTEAVAEFGTAVRLEPGNANARLYLATAYMVQWIPGPDSPENNALAEHASTEFRAVLDMDSNNKTAVASLASLEFNAGKGTVLERQYDRLRHFAE